MESHIRALYKLKSLSEDERRREYILNIILSISIFMMGIFNIVILKNSFSKGTSYNGISFEIFSLILLFYVGLFILVKRGHIRLASYGLITSYLAGALYCGYQWGASLPATIVVFILVIIISSILVNSKFSSTITLFIIILFIILGIHEYQHPEKLLWRLEPINNTDFITYSVILSFIALLSWLSNKETEKSLHRARSSEKELINQRNLLEIKVEERTRELRDSQIIRMNELEKVAEFGRLSQGLFHDLLSPLTAMVLYMEKIRGLPPSELQNSYSSLEKIISVSNKMKNNIDRLRYSIKEKMPEQKCNIREEIQNCIHILQFKLRENNISIEITGTGGEWYGDPIKLHQIFLNLLSNAIDSYDKTHLNEKVIRVGIDKINNETIINIEDRGLGIKSEIIDRIFDPFFTTKPPQYGTGIGLATVKKILDELGGTVRVKSKEGEGSVFIITIP